VRVDLVVNALAAVRVEGVSAHRIEVSAGEEKSLAPLAEAHVVYLTRGEAQLTFESGSVNLHGSDFLLIAPERALQFRAQSDASIVCGTLSVSHWDLPASVHVPADRSQALRVAMDLLTEEAVNTSPASGMIANRLAEIVLLYAVREADGDTQTDPDWLSALTDPRIGTSLKEMYEAAERPWTVAELASVAGMSRSVYAQRFKEVTGEGPLEHLTRRRIEKASLMLRESDRKLSDVAVSIGYSSDGAFHRAFRRVTGISPGEYRRMHA